MTRIANRDAKHYVHRREFFKGSNIFGFWNSEESLYIVTSYGNHFPMLVWDNTALQWFENYDKFSRTTTRHQSRVGDYNRKTTDADTGLLKEIIHRGGIVNVVAHRMGEIP